MLKMSAQAAVLHIDAPLIAILIKNYVPFAERGHRFNTESIANLQHGAATFFAKIWNAIKGFFGFGTSSNSTDSSIYEESVPIYDGGMKSP